MRLASPPAASPRHPDTNGAAAVAVQLAAFGVLLLAGLALARGQFLVTVAGLYVLVYLMLAWTRPHVALLLVFASAPFQSDLSGGLGVARFSLAEINLALSVPVFLVQNLIRGRAVSPGPIALPVLLYFGVCLFSSAQGWHGNDTLISLLQMFLYFVVAFTLFSSFARRPEDLLLSLNGLVAVGVLLAVAGVATSFTFVGMNKNGIGSSLSCAFLVCLELWFAAAGGRRKAFLAAALGVIGLGLLLSLSRGAWLGAVGGVVFLIALRRQFDLLLRAGVVLLPLLALAWISMPAQSRDYATSLDRGRVNIQARYKSIDYALANFDRNPLYGVGVGLRKEYDATNLILLTLAETGALGLLTFALIYVAFFRMVWRTQPYVARTDPQYSLLAVGGALVACSFAHGLVDHYWSRGGVTLSWAGGGMAAAVYYDVRLRATATSRPPARRPEVPA